MFMNDDGAKSVSFKFIGQKRLYDLAKEVLSTPGANAEEYEKVADVAMLAIALLSAKSSSSETVHLVESYKSDMMNHFDLTLKYVRSTESKGILLQHFSNVLKYVFGEDERSGYDKAGGDSNIGPRYGETDGGGRGGGGGGGETGGKRKRENDDEEGRSSKKQREDEEKAAKELERVVSWIPRDVWIEVFEDLPSIFDLSNAGFVNKTFLHLVKSIVAKRYPYIVTKTHESMVSFAAYADLVTGPFDLEWNDVVLDEDVSPYHQVRELSLRGVMNVGNGIKGMTSLRSLYAGASVDDGTLDNSPLLTNLTKLSLSRSCPFEGSIFYVMPKLSTVKLIELEQYGLFSRNLYDLKTLTRLTDLASEAPDLTSEGPDFVDPPDQRTLSTLKILHCGASWTHSRMSHLTNLTELKLALGYDVKDKTLSLLTNLRSLRDSSGSHGVRDNAENSFTNESVSLLTNLTNLSIHGRTMVTGEVLRGMPGLRTLDIASTGGNFEDDQLWYLSSLTDLKLSFDNTNITGECFKNIGAHISRLRLYGWVLEREYVGRLSNVTVLVADIKTMDFRSIGLFKKLVKLTLYETERPLEIPAYVGSFTSHSDIARWEGLTQLTTFALDGVGSHTTNRDWDYLSKGSFLNDMISTWATRLKRLRIGGCSAIDDATMSKLANCEVLNYSDCPNVTFNSIGQLTKLKSLKLSPEIQTVTGAREYDRIVPVSVSPLKNLQNLERLVFEGISEYFVTRQMRDDLRSLAANLPKLKGIYRNNLAPIDTI